MGNIYKVGSIASTRPRELHFTFLCDMGVPCLTSNISLEAKYLQNLSAQLIHYIPLYIYIYIYNWLLQGNGAITRMLAYCKILAR